MVTAHADRALAALNRGSAGRGCAIRDRGRDRAGAGNVQGDRASPLGAGDAELKIAGAVALTFKVADAVRPLLLMTSVAGRGALDRGSGG